MRSEGDAEAENAAWKAIFACLIALVLVVGAPSIVGYIIGENPISLFASITGSGSSVSNIWAVVQAAVGVLAVFGLVWSGIKLCKRKVKKK